MRMIVRAIMGLTALVLLAGASGERPRLTFQGLGDIRIGMSVAELKRIGLKADKPYEGQLTEEYEACHYMSNNKTYPDIGFMINDGRLVRIGIYKSKAENTWKSLSGVHVGMSETEVKAIYGDWLEMDYHPYLGDAGSYLILTSANRKSKMIFETGLADDGNESNASDPAKGPNPHKFVTRFRAGLAEPVGYIEGCS